MTNSTRSYAFVDTKFFLTLHSQSKTITKPPNSYFVLLFIIIVQVLHSQNEFFMNKILNCNTNLFNYET